MSEPRSRIDALLNFSTPTSQPGPVAASTSEQGPVTSTVDQGSIAPTVDQGSITPTVDPGPVAASTGGGGQAQEIPFVAAPQPETDPGMQVFVDGRPVQTSPDGSADFEVTPRGTTPLPESTHSQSGRDSAHPGTAMHQGDIAPPGGAAADGGGGTGADPENVSASAAFQRNGGTHGGGGPVSDGRSATAPSTPSKPAGHGHDKDGARPAGHGGEEVKGLGKHPAEANIVDPHGKGHVPFHVHKNPDGSLDVVVPKGHGHPHEVRIHVPPGHHVNLKLSEDSKGHVKVQAKPAPPADHQKPTPAGAGKGGNAQPPKAGDPKADPKAGNKAPGGAPAGGGASGGGPSGGGPSGGGPSGGGGGGGPTGGPPANNGQNPGGGTRTADPDAMRKLGNDIDSQCGSIMDQAKQQTQKINVSYPAFGVLGFMFNSAHNGVQSDAVNYISSGRSMLNQWKSTLGSNADNWGQAESDSTL